MFNFLFPQNIHEVKHTTGYLTILKIYGPINQNLKSFAIEFKS